MPQVCRSLPHGKIALTAPRLLTLISTCASCSQSFGPKERLRREVAVPPAPSQGVAPKGSNTCRSNNRGRSDGRAEVAQSWCVLVDRGVSPKHPPKLSILEQASRGNLSTAPWIGTVHRVMIGACGSFADWPFGGVCAPRRAFLSSSARSSHPLTSRSLMRVRRPSVSRDCLSRPNFRGFQSLFHGLRCLFTAPSRRGNTILSRRIRMPSPCTPAASPS